MVVIMCICKMFVIVFGRLWLIFLMGEFCEWIVCDDVCYDIVIVGLFDRLVVMFDYEV